MKDVHMVNLIPTPSPQCCFPLMNMVSDSQETANIYFLQYNIEQGDGGWWHVYLCFAPTNLSMIAGQINWTHWSLQSRHCYRLI